MKVIDRKIKIADSRNKVVRRMKGNRRVQERERWLKGWDCYK